MGVNDLLLSKGQFVMSSVKKQESTPTPKKRSRRRNNGEGSVYWDSRREKYVAAYVDINKKRNRAYFDEEDQAHEWRTAQKVARMKGEATFVRDPKSTIGEYLTHWLESRPHLTPNTYRYYDQTIRKRINPFIGHIRIKDLNTKVLESFLNKLIHEKKFKGGTVLGVVRTLKKAFNDGVRWGELPFNPMNRVVVPTIKSTPSPRIPRIDVEKLRIEASKSPIDKARLEIGVSLGLRPGEVAGLKWKDFNRADKQLSVVRQIQRVKGEGLLEFPPKTLRKKPIPLTESEVKILEELRKYRMENLRKISDAEGSRILSSEDYIFPNSLGKAMDPKCDKKWFKRLCDKSGVPRYQRIQMRKTAFTELSYVAELTTVKAYSGHTQISTLVNHYIDIEESAVRDALAERERRYQICG